MSINGISQNQSAVVAAMAAQNENKTAPVAQEKTPKTREDSVSISKNFYTKSKVSQTDAQKVEALKAEANRQTEEFQTFIKSMIAKQGEASNFTLGKLKLNVTPADSLKAKQAISDGGEYSVDAVATRIMDMAMALSGGDASKAETLRNAVKKGFEAAGVELGLSKDKMPSITGQTYDEVMKRFDDWGKGGAAKQEK